MSISRSEFLEIVQTSLAQQLLLDNEIAAYVKPWREENWAALLHANHMTTETPIEHARDLLRLVAAFARKDLKCLNELVNIKKVSVGARLDYFLPLYDETYHGGEDIFVASTKIILGGDIEKDAHLENGRVMHKVGAAQGEPYTEQELSELEEYVNNSFTIREMLRHAPNKTVIQPNLKALDYIIQQADSYLDTNNNPVIVFIPGAISINNIPAADLIEKVLKQGADVNAVGFFGVPGIVWSIILGDIEGVKSFLKNHAKLDIVDEMGNEHVKRWVCATSHAAADDNAYNNRLKLILSELQTNNRDPSPKSKATYANAAPIFNTVVNRPSGGSGGKDWLPTMKW